MRAHIPITSSDVVSSNLSVVARCVALRSRILASVLLFLFRRDANGTRERADDNPLYGVLHDIANANQSTFEFRELMLRCLDLSGYFYARVERNARGGVTSLRPFFPEDVEVELLASGRLCYCIYNGRTSGTFAAGGCLAYRRRRSVRQAQSRADGGGRSHAIRRFRQRARAAAA